MIPRSVSHRFAAAVLLLAVTLAAAACGAAEPRVRLSGEWPTTAGDYEVVVEEWTRSTVLRGAYQEVLELAATLKSPQWHAARAALDVEHRGLVGAAREQRMAQARAAAEGGPFEIQLMVTTWDRRENDLDRGKKSVWRIVLLDASGAEVEPVEIIKDKRPAFMIRAEFPAFGEFAEAYVARFSREAKVLGPDARQVRLRMSSVRGGIEVSWRAP